MAANANKRSGAYSWGAYGTHPYVLLNQQDDLESMFTLAHEMGHAIHTYHSDKAQPFTYAGYLIFVAEVASTCNECLLNHYLLSQEENGDKRNYILNHYLEKENIRFVSSGSRSINHTTQTQDYKERTFGYRKAYCKLHIEYNPKIKWIINGAYPFRNLLKHFDGIRIPY